MVMFIMDGIYQGVSELVQIFDVVDKGQMLVQDLKVCEVVVIEKVCVLDLKGVLVLFWFLLVEIDIDFYVVGCKGLFGYMMNVLGLINVIESDEEWLIVSWEIIVCVNFLVIVIVKMDCCWFEVDDYEKKLVFLKFDLVICQMDVVKNDCIVIFDVYVMDFLICNVIVFEMLVEVLLGFDLK